MRCKLSRDLAFTILIAGQLICSVVGRAGEPPPLKNSTPFASSFTIVPPVAITQHVDFEVRLAVRNHSVAKAKFDIELSIEVEDGTLHPLDRVELEVEPLDQELVSKRYQSRPYLGKNGIRYQLCGPDNSSEQGQQELVVVECESRAVPLLQIGWVDPGSIVSYTRKREVTEQDLRDSIDALHRIGITALIVTYPESIYTGYGVYYPSHIFAEYGSRVPFDVVGTILNQASKNGQKVFVGLGRGRDLYLTWTGFDDAERQQAALAHSMTTASELWSLYADEPSFYGWYLSHEANDIERASRAYYNAIVKFLREFSADKPVLISPSGTPIVSHDALDSSEVDIFAYQDAVGAGYVPYEYTFDPERRIKMLNDVYAEYENAHKKNDKHLWTNLEIWQMDGPNYNNSYPPKFERVKRQLDIAKNHVDVITTYETLGFLGNPDSDVVLGGPAAVDLYKAYEAYYQATAAELGLDSSRRE